MQAGSFVVAHLLFCDSDPAECFYYAANRPPRTPTATAATAGAAGGASAADRWGTAWAYWQKPAALLLCCAGVVTYAVGKQEKQTPRRGHEVAKDEEAEVDPSTRGWRGARTAAVGMAGRGDGSCPRDGATALI